MAARSLGNQFIAGDPSSNPAGSYETAFQRMYHVVCTFSWLKTMDQAYTMQGIMSQLEPKVPVPTWSRILPVGDLVPGV